MLGSVRIAKTLEAQRLKTEFDLTKKWYLNYVDIKKMYNSSSLKTSFLSSPVAENNFFKKIVRNTKHGRPFT